MKNINSENIIGSDGLYGIYGVVGKPFWQTNFFYILLAVIFILIVLPGIYFFVKRNKKNAKQELPEKVALRELRELKKLFLFDKIDNKNFYLNLTSIVKNYFFGRFGYDLFGFTDNELVIFLKDKNFDSNLLEGIEDMFLSMEVVKFANAKTVKELMELDLARCTDLVNKTSLKNLE